MTMIMTSHWLRAINQTTYIRSYHCYWYEMNICLFNCCICGVCVRTRVCIQLRSSGYISHLINTHQLYTQMHTFCFAFHAFAGRGTVGATVMRIEKEVVTEEEVVMVMIALTPSLAQCHLKPVKVRSHNPLLPHVLSLQPQTTFTPAQIKPESF